MRLRVLAKLLERDGLLLLRLVEIFVELSRAVAETDVRIVNDASRVTKLPV